MKNQKYKTLNSIGMNSMGDRSQAQTWFELER